MFSNYMKLMQVKNREGRSEGGKERGGMGSGKDEQGERERKEYYASEPK